MKWDTVFVSIRILFQQVPCNLGIILAVNIQMPSGSGLCTKVPKFNTAESSSPDVLTVCRSASVSEGTTTNEHAENCNIPTILARPPHISSCTICILRRQATKHLGSPTGSQLRLSLTSNMSRKVQQCVLMDPHWAPQTSVQASQAHYFQGHSGTALIVTPKNGDKKLESDRLSDKLDPSHCISCGQLSDPSAGKLIIGSEVFRKYIILRATLIDLLNSYEEWGKESRL